MYNANGQQMNMNQMQQNAARAQQGQQGQGGQGGQQGPQLVRPEHIRKLQCFDDAKKAQVADFLTKSWTLLNSHQPGTQEHQAARNKIEEISNFVRQEHTKWLNARNQAQKEAAAKNAAAGAANNGQASNQAGQNGQPAAGGAGQAAGQGQGGVANAVMTQIMQHVNNFQYTLPPNKAPGSQEAVTWLREAKQRYAQAMQRIEMVKSRINILSQQVQNARNNGSLTPNDEAKVAQQTAQLRQQHEESASFVKGFMAQQQEFKKNQNPPAQDNGAVQSKTEGQEQLSVNTGVANNAGGQMSPALPQSANPANRPQSATTPQQPQAGNVNRVAAGAAGGPARPSPGFPPQAAAPQQPRPLSTEDAIAQSRQSYSGQNPTSASAPPQAMNAMKDQRSPAELPIPRQLAAAPPQPVALAPARPTLSGGANMAGNQVMNQPAWQKPPSYDLEDGRRVLSKKKLDELVRQVTGGVEGEVLDPDVEEAMLNQADEFVDMVVSAACRLAKVRNSSVLELKDVQTVLERQYNIRIPGYTTDDTRFVKRIPPNPAYMQKVAAIAQAKTAD